MDIAEIYGLLRRLGLSAGSPRFFYVSYAVYLTIRQPYLALFVEQWLYPVVARHYHTTNINVKIGISLASDTVWESEGEALRALAKYPLERKPRPSEFISLLAACFGNGNAA